MTDSMTVSMADQNCDVRAVFLYNYYGTRNLGARWAPISSWWPSATLLALRACLTSSFTPFGHSSHVTHADDKFTSFLEQVRFQERGEQCHFGSCWVILGHFGSFLGHFGPFWVILGHFWAILGNFGSFLVILGHFRSFLGHVGSFWVILGHFGSPCLPPCCPPCCPHCCPPCRPPFRPPCQPCCPPCRPPCQPCCPPCCQPCFPPCPPCQPRQPQCHPH